jgi:hypothetical protein
MHCVDWTEGAAGGSTTWHICWQAAVGREFFLDEQLQSRIRSRLLDAYRGPGRALVYYTLLPTELHVVVQLDADDTVGRLAGAVSHVVSRWVRQAQPVRSPVLAGSFRAHRIESAAELRSDVRMLAWRPVFQGLCKTPSHCAHGGLRIALGLTPGQGFDSRYVLAHFGHPTLVARVALHAWVARRPSERECRQWELARGLALATGNAGPWATTALPVRGMDAAMLVAAAGGGIDGALRLLETWVAAKLGASAVLDLHAWSVHGARGRALVGCLAVDLRLCSAASVARHFGRAKATLSEQMTACRQDAADRQVLATPVGRIVEEATALAASVRRRTRVGSNLVGRSAVMQTERS